MKDHMVSKVLKQRLQGDATSTLQQAAFEQVPLFLTAKQAGSRDEL